MSSTMCQQQQSHSSRSESKVAAAEDSTRSDEPFPWDGGVFDAHCHPTDTMSSIASIPGMRARTLTIMATRSQDQDLVASVASQHGIQSRAALTSASQTDGRVVPAFGWHPWFSYQLYDDALPAGKATYNPSSEDKASQKAGHYRAVLNPEPDPSFIASLPDPAPLSSFLSATRSRLQAHPLALVGEVGLDKIFRLPEAWADRERKREDDGLTAGGREGRRLSPHNVGMAHQAGVLRAQLRLAAELGRAVSVHGVQAPGVLFDLLQSTWKGHERLSRRERRMVAAGAEDFSESSADEDEGEGGSSGERRETTARAKPYPPRICLHSFSAPVEVMKQYLNPSIPARIFFSFSVVVNLSTAGGEKRFPEMIRACPDDQLLIESDVHCAGEDMDHYLEQMYRKVCEIKGWTLQEGVERVRKNYEEFIFG